MEYATLDFVCGAASMLAYGGYVRAPSRIDLEAFLKNLPGHANELQGSLRQREAEIISLSFGPNTVSLAQGTKINGFIRQVTKRFTEVKQVLEQADEIGLRIKRRPYSEYIDEIGRIGICRVECHGYALFVDGRLIFYPKNQVRFVRVTGNTAEVHSLNDDIENGPQCIN
jgi:hypothetical protein